MSAAPLSPPDEVAAIRRGERQRVTLELADRLARLVARLRARLGDDRRAGGSISRFVIACCITLFAEDLGLLPAPGLRAALHGDFAAELQAAWRRLAQLEPLVRRSGDLLTHAPALTPDELAELARAARHDWSEVEPAIFGTLLEQSLRADERSQQGAHFTPREDIERLIEPTILEPLRHEWQQLILASSGPDPGAPHREFLARLRRVEVLDPACGTGNFLYIALDLLKQLEREVLAVLRELGEAPPPAASLVQPEQMHGIEKNPWSAEIAGLVLWLGHLQWRRREHEPPIPSPRPDIIVGDALLTHDAESEVLDPDGLPLTLTRQGKAGLTTASVRRSYLRPRASAWPEVDFIVSNPPFIGNKRMRELLGDGYAEAVRDIFKKADEVPGDVDYVAYWWHRAAVQLRAPGSRLRRFGFITTNSIRQRQSGAVLRRHLGDDLVLHFACPDHPWIDPTEELGSAAVRISMTVVRRADEPGARPPRFVEDLDARRGRRSSAARSPLRETITRTINPDLTIGADLTAAVPLLANADLCFQGMNLVGEGFRLSPEQAASLPGATASPALRRYIQGRDLKRAATIERRVIDFFGLDEHAARTLAPALFAHLTATVRPLRAHNGRDHYRREWWVFGEARPGLRRAVAGLSRYIATPETSRHRFFVLLDADVIPDHQIYVIASDDPFMLGVLSSVAHTTWALRAGGSNGAGNDPRYNSTATFLPFPFPDPTPAQRDHIAALALRLDRARRELLASAGDASLTSLYNTLERLRAAPTGAARAGRCDELLRLHDELDAAVLAAYDLAPDLDEPALLAALLQRNRRLAADEARGVIRWPRPEFQRPLQQRRAAITAARGAPARERCRSGASRT